MISAEYTIPGMHVRDHVTNVPLDWNAPDGATMQVFAREVVDPVRRHDDLPILLFLQGGPGGKATRPMRDIEWIPVALARYRLVLLDQRGTGRSTRVDGARMAAFDNAGDAAEFLTHFRADSIVRDAEHLRRTVFGGRRWSTLGQSFGGFITLTYLSFAPEGLASCFVTGGLAGIHPSAAEVYRRTTPRVLAKNRAYFDRYPDDVARVAVIADRLADNTTMLPDGDVLTVRRFQSLGLDFGMKPSYERMHWLVDESFAGVPDRLADIFLQQVQAATSHADDPLFAVMHESAYVDAASGASAWAAQHERDRTPQFAEDARPLCFTGEMIYPWMFDEVRLLRPFGPAVHELAARTEWCPLYDPAVLAANEVPVAAAIYFDDMYVDSALQLETAASVGALQPWVTSEYEHDGLQHAPVLRRLMAMVDDAGGPLPR